MNEERWLSGTDPQAMLGFLPGRGKASTRKLRLWGCACVRRVWHLLTDRRTQRAVEVAENYADGLAGEADLLHAKKGVSRFFVVSAKRCWRGNRTSEWLAAATAEAVNETRYSRDEASRTARMAARAVRQDRPDEPCSQAALLRDVFGLLPFQPATIDLAWRTPTILTLAEAAYEERSLPEGTLEHARLMVLADALEEARCSNSGLLEHLQGPGPHVRGCWVVDLILNRE